MLRLVVSTFIREKQPFLKKVVLTSSAIKEDKTSQTKEKYVFKVKILIWLYEVPRKILRGSEADQFKAKIHRRFASIYKFVGYFILSTKIHTRPY